jgi:hypothetical protein
MVRTLRVLLAAAFMAFAINLAPQAAGTADAAGCVKIFRIYYDSPGTDGGSNLSLNGEWIQLKSACAANKSLTGWKIRDVANHWYTFGSYTLKAGAKVKIHTGSGTNTATDRYQALDGYVWNNTGDKAWLYNASGSVMKTCAYAGGSPGYKYC